MIQTKRLPPVRVLRASFDFEIRPRFESGDRKRGGL